MNPAHRIHRLRPIWPALFTALAAHATLSAAPITPGQARSAAESFLTARFRSATPAAALTTTALGSSDFAVAAVVPVSLSNTVVGFAARLTPTGFVLLRADDQAPPVKLYADTGAFENLPPAFLEVLGVELAEELAELAAMRAQNRNPAPEFQAQWSALLTPRVGPRTAGDPPTPTAGITLVTTSWDQNAPYNLYCPPASGGPGDRAYAGCTATAVAQIVRYYRHPHHVFLDHTYADTLGSCQGTRAIRDAGMGAYAWADMPATVTVSSPRPQQQAVAQLTYHAAVALDSNFEATATTAYPNDVPNVLRTYFGCTASPCQWKSDFASTQWYAKIATEIDALRPVFYGMWQSDWSVGHAAVCDGYRNGNEIHLNLGWSGAGTAWYNIDSINYSTIRWTRHVAVFGIAPAAEPEIEVRGNGIVIVEGDSTPSAADATDFGSTPPAAAVSRTFTVSNLGTATLAATRFIVPSGFAITEDLSPIIAPGNSATFTVRLAATAPGTYTGEVSFADNDPDENPFRFRITGTVTAPTADVAWVTARTLGSPQNTLSAWLGLRLKVGTSPLTVTELGRIYINGNTATHELRLIDAASRVTVAAAFWSPVGGIDGAFCYVRLATPVTLAPNTQYFLVSRESSGGDRWYNAATILTTTSAASLPGSAYSPDGLTWILGRTAGKAFGPLDFKYTVADGTLPVITVAATDPNAAEPADTGAFTFTRSGPTAAPLTVSFTLAGTATAGTDFTALDGTITFAAGSATATQTVAVIDDSAVEGTETIALTLTAGTGYTVGNPASATIAIADNDTLPVVTVAATDPNAAEPADTGTFTFTRTGSTAAPLTVSFTVAGSATAGTDYTALDGTITFAASSATATQTVAVIDDTAVEGTETVVLTLATGTGYTVGNRASATIAIADNDTLPVVTVAATDPGAAEPADTGSFTFTRTGSTTAPLTVSFTVSGSATAGTDYTALGDTVTFAAGSATATQTVAIIDDTAVEGTETIALTLTAGTGYTVGNPASATIAIADNDTFPVVTVAATDPDAAEPADTGTFTFTRTGSTTAALTVNFTVAGTASAGTDYTALGGTVTFAAGSATATQTVAIIDDTAVEETETVVLTLAAGTGYTVGSPASATVAIADNDTPRAELAWVTGSKFGTLQSTLTAWLGLRLKVGATPLTVSRLGRIYIGGNTATHELRIIDATTKATVASAPWDPAGGVDGTFRYVRLAAPVILAPNTEYWLVSRETSGGDRWYNAATTLTTTRAATLPGSVYSPDGLSWTLGSVAGRAFGPLDFIYTTATTGAGIHAVASVDPNVPSLTGLAAAPAASPSADGQEAGRGGIEDRVPPLPGLPFTLRIHLGASVPGIPGLAADRFLAPPGAVLVLEFSEDLAHWAPVDPQPVQEGVCDLYHPQPASSTGFYRFRIPASAPDCQPQ